MKVLLLGSTGNVGSRLLSALLAHSHTPVLYVRNASKLPQQVLTSLPSSDIVIGDATDKSAIAKAIQDHNCEAVVSAAGIAGMFSRTEQFPQIFKAIVEATAMAGKERGRPIRCWMLGGFGMLDIPGSKNGAKLVDYLRIFPDHKENYDLIQTIPENEVAWSILCANQMTPSKESDATAQTKAATDKIIATADVPPNWTPRLAWVPFFGTLLNVFSNAMGYATTLEQAAESIARDLDKGMNSEFINKRVGIIVVK